jgi:hypothetical protein
MVMASPPGFFFTELARVYLLGRPQAIILAHCRLFNWGLAMSQEEAELGAESSEGLTVLFDTLLDHSEELEKDSATFQATPAKSGTLGSGLPEITNIIIALGSSGAFVALSAVLRTYFDKRPQGIITISLRSAKRQVQFTAENCTPDLVTKNIRSLLNG